MQEASQEDLASPEPEGEESLTFYATLAGAHSEKHGQALEVRFPDLCGPCKKTIKALLEQIGKRIEGVSPDRKPTEKKAAAAKKAPAAKEKVPAPSHGAAPDPNHATQTAGSRTPAAGVARA
jgi:hypothetical protein